MWLPSESITWQGSSGQYLSVNKAKYICESITKKNDHRGVLFSMTLVDAVFLCEETMFVVERNGR
jgi:hypothetical protein